ncbi:MAG: hypothetical protein E5Y67_30850 [Mesorhizobium sp.]|uniref:hypothetical protein n=1 Tax=Mesorhizobium sp. TaxID=1871066 RepID=UPI0011FBCF83|nr:hypothetical protein [Mesorhizobium sp.]TIM06690.1 MAG: hypothetical protein E5Y67_30850 [Mesorhizobium sp.]
MTPEQIRQNAIDSAERAVAEVRKREAEQRKQEEAHVAACLAAGVDPQLGPDDTAKAKQYSRGYAFQKLPQAWLNIGNALTDPNIKLGDKIDISLEVIKRAIGPAEMPSSMNVDFTAIAPMEGIDLLIKARAAGTITSDFADSMIKLLKSKIMETRRQDSQRRTKPATSDSE